MDKIFKNPVYADTFRREFEFAQYNDKSRFWISVEYFIMRDSFVSRVSATSPLALDFDLTAENGEKIFRNLNTAPLLTLGYVLINEEVEVSNADEDIYKVTELYGYAPDVVFEKYSLEIVGMPGLIDNSVVSIASAQLRLNAAGEIYFPDSSYVCYPGDELIFTRPYTVMGSIYLAATSAPSTVIRREGSNVICNAVSWLASNGNGATSQEIIIIGITYGISRVSTTTEPRNVQVNMIQSITYHTQYPIVDDKLQLLNGNSITEYITANTSPNLATWNMWKNNKSRLILVEPEVEGVYTLFKKLVKRCAVQ